MSKLLIASLLFVGLAAAVSTEKTFWASKLGASSASIYGVYVGAGSYNEKDTDINGYTYTHDKRALMPENMCYFYFYDEMGCTGEPHAFFGYAHTGATVQAVAQMFGTASSTSSITTKVQDYTSSVALYTCGTLSYDWATTAECATDLPANFPVGCTDIKYTWFQNFGWTINEPRAGTPHLYGSMLVICDEEAPCPRDCATRACGDYDACGTPCVAECAKDGYYCHTDLEHYTCLPEVYGDVSYYALINYASGAKRTVPTQDYITPVITHLENAFVDDISRATAGIVLPESITMSYSFYSHASSKIDMWFTIHVDEINARSTKTYTRSDIEALIESYFVSSEQSNDGQLAGVFTRAFDLTQSRTSSASGITSAAASTTDSDWVSFSIPSSWIPNYDESSASSVAVCLAAIVAALLLHL